MPPNIESARAKNTLPHDAAYSGFGNIVARFCAATKLPIVVSKNPTIAFKVSPFAALQENTEAWRSPFSSSVCKPSIPRTSCLRPKDPRVRRERRSGVAPPCTPAKIVPRWCGGELTLARYDSFPFAPFSVKTVVRQW